MRKQNEQNTTYKPMLQGTGTNALMTVNTKRRKPKEDYFTGMATLQKGDNLTIFFKNYNEALSQLRPSMQKLLCALTIQLTAQNTYNKTESINRPNTAVAITLGEYMDICGISKTKTWEDTARDIMKQDAQTLFDMSIDWTENRGGKKRRYGQMRVIDRYEVKNGVLYANFALGMAEYLTQAYIMQFPLALLKTDNRNPNVFSLGYKLAFHYGLKNNRTKGTHNFVSVEALVNSCSDLPSFEEASASRQVKQRIIKPFERALCSLAEQGVLESWCYCDEDRVPFGEEKSANISYLEFIGSYVLFELVQNYVSYQCQQKLLKSSVE
jgi:hypothetical protein